MRSRTLSFRRLGLALLTLVAAGAGESPDAPGQAAPRAASAVYAQDVEFLLVELEKRAGHFFALKGIDWTAVGREFREAVCRVSSDAGHVELCQRLVARLKDGHASLREVRPKLPDPSAGRRWCGPSVHLMTVGSRVYLRQAFGPASAQGLRIGDEVRQIDGLPAREWLDRRVTALREERGYSTEHQALYAACHWGVGGWQGTSLALVVGPAAAERRVTLPRQGGANFVPVGPVFPPRNLQRVGRQSYGRTPAGTAYIHLRDIPAELPDQLDLMLEAVGSSPRLILDLRANGGGGCDHGAVFGRFLAPGQSWQGAGSSGRKPFTGPMVLIVDPGTRSAGETVAAMFKEGGRAHVLGEGPTAGTSSQKTTIAVPSGLFSVYFSVASNGRRYNQERGIEGLGIAPHEVVPYQPEDLTAGVDTLIRRAEEWLAQPRPDPQPGPGNPESRPPAAASPDARPVPVSPSQPRRP